MSKAVTFSGLSGVFHMPEIVGRAYAPGPQPYNPGESVTPNWPGSAYKPTPWPRGVQTLSTLANFGGMPQARAEVPINNALAGLPENFLFMAGFTGKSQG